MTRHIRGRHGRILLAGAALLLPVALAGCSNVGGTSCAEFGELGYNDRQEMLEDLLVEHRLEPYHLGNMLGVSYAVDEFCGTSSSLQPDNPATKNLDRPLDESHDWDSQTWDTPGW